VVDIIDIWCIQQIVLAKGEKNRDSVSSQRQCLNPSHRRNVGKEITKTLELLKFWDYIIKNVMFRRLKANSSQFILVLVSGNEIKINLHKGT